MHFVKLMTENLQTLEEKGTGLGALAMVGAAHRTGLALPRGGSAKLAAALKACIKHHRGVIATEIEVSAILREGGRVIGVRTEHGPEFGARDAVIGSVHPHHLRRYFPDVDAGVLNRAERVQLATYSAIVPLRPA